MLLKFLGASSGIVTGSSYILTSGSGASILIDLGMFQGLPSIDRLNYMPYDYDAHRLSGAILTHAHLDHCGRLPIILPMGFEGNIWMTTPTADLTELSLYDTAKIAQQDQKQILFDKELVADTVGRFKITDYHKPFTIGSFTITMRNAGHILGSASLEIVDNQPNSGMKKILSGDLGNSPQPLQQPTETFEGADAVVIESTYGDKLHPEGDPSEIIASEINTIEKTGAALLMPAFSLERTQELLHIMMHLKQSGQIRGETPIYLDSPMGEKATFIYTQYPGDFNEHIQSDLQKGSPYEFDGLNIIERKYDSQNIDVQPGPKVIIAGSGMMTGGRILSHAAHYLPMASTRLLIVGYQGEGTIGRQLQEGKKSIQIDRQTIGVQATITETRTMSSHADQGQLMSWLKSIQGVKKVFITHGEDPQREALRDKVKSDLQLTDITLPTLSQEVTF